MASSYSRDMVTHCIAKLCDLYKDLDRALIEMVAARCSFDVDRSAKVLYKMIEENNQVLSTNRYPNGTRPKPTAPLPTNSYDRLIGFIKEGYKILILMRGLPGSGKSTLAISLLQQSLGSVNRDEFIYSTDQYFYRTGVYKHDPKELEVAHAWNQRRCFSNLKRGVSPVMIDNTNLTMKEMKVYCVMAVKFGYMIEILEAMTPWALNPSVLSTKNCHGVSKQKIQEMNERYQLNIAVKDLLREFQLNYDVTLPQHRRYPPIPRPVVNVDVVDEPRRKEQQLPIEYVHKFEMKSEIPKVEEVRISDINDLVLFNNESKVKQQIPEDLISFNQEHKSPDKTEASVNAHLVKQLEENNKLMYKMTEIVSMHMQQRNNSSTVADVDMEVDTPNNNGNDDPMQLSSSSRKLSYLEEENLKLQAELNRTKSEAEVTRSTNPFATLTSKQTQGDAPRDTLQARRLQMYFKNTNTEKGSIEDFEIVSLESSPSPISDTKSPLAEGENSAVPKLNSKTLGFTVENWESIPPPLTQRNSLATGATAKTEKSTSSSTSQIKPVNITTTTTTTAKAEKSAIPKFDSKAWGLPEDVLAPWDPIPPQEISDARPHTKDALLMTCEQGTNTTDEDFKIVRQGSVGKAKPLAASGVPINRENFSIKRRSRKNATLDKGCMTDEEELLLGLNLDEKEQVKKLMELFPGIPVEDMLYVYEKCDKDFHWAVDLISSSPMVFPSITKGGSEQKNKDPDTPEKKAPKSSSFNFELNDWNLVPTNSDKVLKTSEDAAAKKNQEEAEQQKKQEEVQELKKQLEKTVTFGKEHYSEHIWQIKNAKMGVPSTSTSASASAPPQPEEEPEPDELMTVDDDMIYISDDSSEEEFNGEDGEGSTDDDLVELNLGDELVQQLESMFGQLSLENFKPIVQVPESLARQLHAFYLESICRQIENQSDYITSQLKEDEEFAKKLQEAERESASGNKMEEIMDEQLAMNLYKKEIDQRKGMSPDTLALKLSKQKLHATFPMIEEKVLDEIMAAHDNNYMETIQAIIGSTNVEPADATNVLEPPISDLTLKEMKAQAHVVDKVTAEEVDGSVQSAQSYRDDANRHMQKHKELQELARRYWSSRNYAVTMFYSELAQKELKKADLANQRAAQCFIRENSSKLRCNDTLDLHFQYVDGALTSLDVFVDFQISNLRATNKPSGTYFVITGWGKHNPNGKSVLKPLVMRRLKQRQINFSIVNPGMLKIKLLKNLPMSTDIKKKLRK